MYGNFKIGDKVRISTLAQQHRFQRGTIISPSPMEGRWIVRIAEDQQSAGAQTHVLALHLDHSVQP